MTPEETKKCIEVMQAYVEGAIIECLNHDEPLGQWRVIESIQVWDWNKYDYRIRPKTIIPVTKDEFTEMELKWYKSKTSGLLFCPAKDSDSMVYPHEINYKDYLILNPDTKCWEDWGEK